MKAELVNALFEYPFEEYQIITNGTGFTDETARTLQANASRLKLDFSIDGHTAEMMFYRGPRDRRLIQADVDSIISDAVRWSRICPVEILTVITNKNDGMRIYDFYRYMEAKGFKGIISPFVVRGERNTDKMPTDLSGLLRIEETGSPIAPPKGYLAGVVRHNITKKRNRSCGVPFNSLAAVINGNRVALGICACNFFEVLKSIEPTDDVLSDLVSSVVANRDSYVEKMEGVGNCNNCYSHLEWRYPRK